MTTLHSEALAFLRQLPVSCYYSVDYSIAAQMLQDMGQGQQPTLNSVSYTAALHLPVLEFIQQPM